MKNINISSSLWKNFLRNFFRLLMIVVFLSVIIIPIYGFIVLEDELTWTNVIFGWKTNIGNILIVITLVLVPLGIIGLIYCIPMIKGLLQRKKSNLTRQPKILAVVIIGLILGITIYYFPFGYYNLGITLENDPYIAFHGENGMQISWDTRTSQLSEVYYGISENSITEKASGGEFYWEQGQLSNHHCVVINNLVPGQTYYYKVPSISDKIYRFKAAPLAESQENVIFSIVGDTHGSYNILKLNIDLMKEQIGLENLDFTVIAGDLVSKDDDMRHWATIFDSKSYGGLASSIPFHAASGNHECGCYDDECERRANYKKYFQNSFVENFSKEDQWDTACYYSFNYSNVHMVILDNFSNYTNGAEFTQRQLDWLDGDLGRNKNNWKFLVFHLSIYSTSEHGPYVELQKQLEPLMYKHRVNAIFYGHDHIFEAYHINATSSEYGGTYAFMVSGGPEILKRVTDEGRMEERIWNGTKNEYGHYIMHANYQSNLAIRELAGAEYQLYGEVCNHYMKVEVDNNIATFSAYRSIDGSLIQNYSMNFSN